MFDRFTDESRQVVVAAQRAALELHHGEIGTEHLLLGLLTLTDDPATHAARSVGGVTVEQVRERVVAIVGAGEHRSEGQMPFTPRAKKAMELALRESLRAGSVVVTPAHILLGLLSEDRATAAVVLRELGVDFGRLRDALRGLDVARAAARAAAGARGGRVRAELRPGGIHVDLSDTACRLLRSAAARALDDDRELIEVADIEEALRRIGDAREPPRDTGDRGEPSRDTGDAREPPTAAA